MSRSRMRYPISRLSLKRHFLVTQYVLRGCTYEQAGRKALVSQPRARDMFKNCLVLSRRTLEAWHIPVSGRVDLVRKDRKAWEARLAEAKRILLGHE